MRSDATEQAQLEYDSLGRIETVQVGTSDIRRYQFGYDSRGYLESVTDPLDQTTYYINDESGRTVKTVLPDSREIGFTYDPAPP